MRHSEKAIYKDRPVNVAIGYDNPISGFFMIIEPIEEDNPDANEETGLIYSNLDDKDIPFPGMTQDIEHYKKRLKEMGITMSPDFFGTVLAVCD